MEEFIDVSVFDELAAGQKNAQSVVDSLVLGIERYLGLKPYYNTIKVEIGECKANSDNIFDLGVSRKIENHKISLLLAKENEEFFPFILLREVFNGFIPPEIRT